MQIPPTLPPVLTIIEFLGIVGGTLAVLKVGWAVAEFFVGLAKGLENLTEAVTNLTERFDQHAHDITDGLSDVRERVASLESWRHKE